MNRISAADNLTIEMQPDHWRLIANGDGGQRTLFEAQPGQPVRYITPFAISRRLPETGALPAEQIQRVVLGWSSSDEAWHLGLVLRQELAEARGSRWCEVAHWPDPDKSTYNDLAAQAGETLAQAITRPFYLVPPKAQPAAPERPLPDLPLRFDIWRFEHAAEGRLQFVREPSWARGTVRRILWYILWTVVYIVLVVASLTAGIAPVRPEFLPLLGVFSALVLVGLIFMNLYRLLTWPDRIVIDPQTQTVAALRGRAVRWRLLRDELDAVYVSHVLTKNQRKTNPRRPTAHYSELNLRRANGTFRHLLHTEHALEYSLEVEDMAEQDVVLPLTADEVATPLQAVAVYMARALNLPCWYDRRF